MPRSRLLLLTEVFPFPLDNGGHIRVHNLILSFRRDLRVTCVCPRPACAEDAGRLEALCERVVYAEPPMPGTSRVRSLKMLPLYGYASPNILALLDSYAAALDTLDFDDYDIVWCERLVLSPLVRGVIERTVLDLDDLVHVKFLREARTATGVIPRLRALERGARWFLRETRLPRRALASVVCSEEDAAYLSRFGPKNVRIVPNGTELPVSLPPRVAEGRGRLVFLGNMLAAPNLDAVRFLDSQIMPLVRERRPNVTLDVIGPGVSDGLRAEFGGRISFRGFVADLGEALATYDVFVAPLRFGGGTKLKVLDAMANGIPLVATPVAAEGLRLEHGVSAMIASSARDIASHVNRLLVDPKTAAAVAREAHALASQHFGWENIRARTADWLATLVAPDVEGSIRSTG
jgi:polysaccharide biosynthesis protein PslH